MLAEELSTKSGRNRLILKGVMSCAGYKKRQRQQHFSIIRNLQNAKIKVISDTTNECGCGCCCETVQWMENTTIFCGFLSFFFTIFIIDRFCGGMDGVKMLSVEKINHEMDCIFLAATKGRIRHLD